MYGHLEMLVFSFTCLLPFTLVLGGRMGSIECLGIFVRGRIGILVFSISRIFPLKVGVGSSSSDCSGPFYGF